jgi:hypothetical protein
MGLDKWDAADLYWLGRAGDARIVYRKLLTCNGWALNSAVECHPHTVEVVGSNPTAPTIFSMG